MSSMTNRMSRRGFVETAAATALGLPILLRAAEKKAAASDRLALGFIGMGTMNRGHLGHFLGKGEVQVVAVCDVDTTRRENAKKIVQDRYGEQLKKGTYKGCAAYLD